MKTLVAYASKFGTTEMCARQVAEKLSGEVDFLDLKKSIVTEIDNYDKVIIGGSINAGKIQKETTQFVNKYFDQLKAKKLGLFICNMEDVPEKAMKELTNNYPKELLDVASAKEWFGGVLELEKMNPLMRFMIKKIAKTEENIDHLQPKHIDTFAAEMNKA